MSTLTRIFIVLMVVFSIAFTTTTISFVARTAEWRKLAEDYQKQQIIIETHMRNQAAAHAAELTGWLDVQKGLQDQIAELRKTEAELRAQLSKNENQIAELQAKESSATALAARQASALEIANAGWALQRDQREKLEQRRMELEQERRQCVEQRNELEATNLVLVQEKKQLEQQINIMKDENDKLAEAIQTGRAPRTVAPVDAAGTRAAAAPAQTPIRGKIIEVQGDLATITVGSSDGVQAGMTFVVYRGSDYVADIKVTDVEPELAAGRIVGARMAPRSGDMVTDEPTLGMAR